MAYITVNESGSFPALLLTTDIAGSNVGNLTTSGNGFLGGNILSVSCLQDITITNSTGIFSWTDFCSASVNKVTTPSDNEISTNIVINDEVFFGDGNATANTTPWYGVSGLSQERVEVAFRLQLNNNSNTGNTLPANTFAYWGKGYLSSVAPTVSPDSPVWVSPLTLAVSGDMGSGPKI